MAQVKDLQLKSQRFRAEREADWRRLEGLLTKAENRSASRLSDDELLAIPVLYRAALSSLSVARATSLDHSLIDYLESLATRAYFFVYGARASLGERIGSFFVRTWPAAVKDLWRETLASFLITIGSAIVGYLLVAHDPNWYGGLAPLAEGRDFTSSTQELRQGLYDTAGQDALALTAAYVFQNNAGIALFSFALGFAFCVPTALLLAYNGLQLGAFLDLYVTRGLGWEAGGWLSIHGTTEIFAIVLGGAAGFRIGWRVAFPGENTRLESAAAAGRAAAPAVAGVVLMLICAGFLEGFGRQMIQVDWERYAIGLSMLFVWLGYFYIPLAPEARMTVVGTTAAPSTVEPRELRQFVTPEGVDLRLRIGTAGERAAAFLLDFMFLVLALAGFTLVVVFALAGLAQVGAADIGKGLSDIMLAIWLLGFFAVRNFYFIVFELSARAATPGKRILGLRVAARDGGRLTAEAVFVRNAMREIEIFLPLQVLAVSLGSVTDAFGGWLIVLGLAWSGGFALFPLFNRDRLRVGDLVAGTWVVKSRRERLSIDLLDVMGVAAQSRFVFSVEQANAYGIKELHVLEDVLRRRDPKTMAAVAERIRGKIAWRKIDAETDPEFLTAYYGALRARLETRLLFGHRRRDKFDKA